MQHAAGGRRQQRLPQTSVLTIYSENQFECNTNAINKFSLCDTLAHTHIHACQYVTLTHTRRQPYSMHSACAIFNFLSLSFWPPAAITINITQTRQKENPLLACPTLLSPPLSLSPSLPIAYEPCHPYWYWCKWKMSTIFARGQRKQTARVLQTVRTWTWIRMWIWVHSTK